VVLSRRVLLGTAAGGVLAGCVPGTGSTSSAEAPPNASPAVSTSEPTPSPSADQPVLRLAVASDLHYGEDGTDYIRFTEELIERLNATHESTPLDLVVLNGDLAHAARWLDDVRERLQDLRPTYAVVQGNHDEATEKQWQRLWGHGFNHTVEVNGVRIVCPGTSNAAGDYVCADRSWLSTELDEAVDAPVIVAMHITPVAWTKHGIDCPAITRLLGERRNVLAVLNAHDHDEYGIKTREGVPYLFGARAGGHWGTDFRGFRVLELFADRRIETHVTDGRRIRGSDSLPPRS